MDVINIIVDENHFLRCPVDTIARDGEGNVTKFEITFPEKLSAYWVYVDFKMSNGEKFKSPRLDVEGNKATYVVPPYVLIEGKLKAQVLFQNGDGAIWKSYKKPFTVRGSINAVDDIPEKEDFIAEAQQLLDDIRNGGGGGSVAVDDKLSTTSKYPVQNKVVTGAINGLNEAFDGLAETVDGAMEIVNDFNGDLANLSERVINLERGGADGEDGATFTPDVSADGVLSWSNDKGLDNPAPVNIKGADGKDGYTPVKGVDYFDGQDGKDGKTPVKGVDYFDGEDGQRGATGNGISSVLKTDTNGLVDTYTITFTNGTKTVFTVTNGGAGKDGEEGVGVASVEQTETSSADGGTNVITVTLTDGTKATFAVKNGSKGSKGNDGRTPVKGEDYYTEGDKAEIVAELVSSAPVRSVNGKTGAVSLVAADVGARPSTWTPTYADVGAEKSGTANSAVSAHNTKDDAHNDIRLLISGLSSRLDALANSDDDTLDQMAEVVAYIKANRNLIEQITTGKVSVADIVNNLTTNVTNKPLSAAQGVALKALVDAITVPTKLAELSGDATHRVVTDAEKTAWNAKSDFSGNYADLAGKPTIPTVPTKVSAFTNDAGYLTGYEETDPTVPAWAKAASKPSYSKSEVGLGNVDNVKQYSASNPPPYPVTSVNGKTGAVTVSVPTKTSQLTNDSGFLTAHQDISGKADKSSAETWTFTLEDGSTVTKKVVLA